MVEYRPDASDIWRSLRTRLGLIRRIALALGGAMLAGGIAACLGPSRSDAAGTAAVGGALIGFFAPAMGRRGELPGGHGEGSNGGEAGTGT